MSRVLRTSVVVAVIIVTLLTAACTQGHLYGWEFVLQDGASPADVASLQRTLSSDPRVDTVEYVSREQAAAEGNVDTTEVINGAEIVSKAGGAYMSVMLRPGSTKQDFDELQQSIESDPLFLRVAQH